MRTPPPDAGAPHPWILDWPSTPPQGQSPLCDMGMSGKRQPTCHTTTEFLAKGEESAVFAGVSSMWRALPPPTLAGSDHSRSAGPPPSGGPLSARRRIRRRSWAPVDDLINEAKVARFLRRQISVALHLRLDRLKRLTRVMHINQIEPGPCLQDFARLDLDVRRLPLSASGRLMDHDLTVGQCVTLALGASREQQRTSRRGHADANGGNRATDVLHRVVDREAGGHDAAGAIDIERNIF